MSTTPDRPDIQSALDVKLKYAAELENAHKQAIAHLQLVERELVATAGAVKALQALLAPPQKPSDPAPQAATPTESPKA